MLAASRERVRERERERERTEFWPEGTEFDGGLLQDVRMASYGGGHFFFFLTFFFFILPMSCLYIYLRHAIPLM